MPADPPPALRASAIRRAGAAGAFDRVVLDYRDRFPPAAVCSQCMKHDL